MRCGNGMNQLHNRITVAVKEREKPSPCQATSPKSGLYCMSFEGNKVSVYKQRHNEREKAVR